MASQESSAEETIIDRIRAAYARAGTELLDLEVRAGQSGDRPWRDPLLAPMRRGLLACMAAEEALLYTPLEAWMPLEMAGARTGHDRVRELLDRLSPGHEIPREDWTDHLRAMQKEVGRGIETEEHVIFPAAERLMGRERLLELGATFTHMAESAAVDPLQ
jgi:hypothetical protein